MAARAASEAAKIAQDAQWAWADAVEAARENSRAIGAKRHELSDAKAALLTSATGRGFSQ
jgi:hypothetical protein